MTDGFERSLAPVVDDASEELPRGHERRASVVAHVSDLPRLGIGEKLSCDVCAQPGATLVDRERLRPSVARWITKLCGAVYEAVRGQWRRSSRAVGRADRAARGAGGDAGNTRAAEAAPEALMLDGPRLSRETLR
jgi:hypothetical protein